MFGGSFNPMHYGHLNIIEAVAQKLKLNELWILPNQQSPLKAFVSGPNPQQKLEIVRLGLDTLSASGLNIKVLDIEIKKPNISYTIDTLTELAKEHKQAEFHLIIGMDQLLVFNQWKQYLKILKMANLIVTSRPGYTLPTIREELPTWLSLIFKSMSASKVRLSTGKQIQFVQLNDVAVSASEIRRKLRRGESVNHLTPGTIVEYLGQNKIYDPNEALVADYKEFTQFCAKQLIEKGGLAVSAYDVRAMVQPSEYTIVASGTSQRHTKSLCENIIKAAKDRYGIHPQSTEGMDEGRWAVVDYGSLIIHVFYDFVRNEYRIEDLWSRAEKIVIS